MQWEKKKHMLCLPDIPGMSSSRLRNSGQSPLSLRTPVKAVAPAGPMGPGRLPVVHAPPSGGGRRIQSSAASNGGVYISGRASAGSGRPAVSRGQTVPSSSTRSKLSQPPRRWVEMAHVYQSSINRCYCVVLSIGLWAWLKSQMNPGKMAATEHHHWLRMCTAEVLTCPPYLF